MNETIELLLKKLTNGVQQPWPLIYPAVAPPTCQYTKTVLRHTA